MSDTPDHAPLFRLFWENGVLNPTRALQMAERIGHDAVHPQTAPRPLHVASASPLPAGASALLRLYRQRRSERHYSAAALDAATLGHLLQPFAARRSDEGDRRLLASGGGKYPLLVYVALYRTRGLPALDQRLAWYDPQQHGLAPVGPVPPWPQMATALGVDWADPPALVVLFAARGEATLRKYGERGGRFLLLEAGAYMGALGLQLADAGWAGTPLGSFLDTDLLAAFGLSTHGVLPMLAYACGGKTDGA